MNPYKLREVYKQLTSQNSILKKYLKLGTKDIKQPDLPAFVEQKNMFNRFMRDNPRPDQLGRKDMAGGGMLVQPSADGSRPGYAEAKFDDPSADRKVSIQDKTGTIALISGFKLDGTDSSKTNEGDFLVLDTSDDENDRLLFEDGTSDPIAVLASHGITLSGQGWNAFQFENP